jgi:integrase
MVDITYLIKHNRTRLQKGQRFETDRAFFVRYYHTGEDGKRKQKAVLLAYKSDIYRSWVDVEPLAKAVIDAVNSKRELPAGPQDLLTTFIETHYLPWCEKNLAAPTVYSYRKVWERCWKPTVGKLGLANLSTAMVTAVLTDLAKTLGSRTLSHAKWMLSGVYGHAIARGILPGNANPVPPAQWLHRVARPKTQAEYSLDQVLAMLRILEPIDLRAAVAVALAYFAALRPAEIRGLQWLDYVGSELHIKRTVWRNMIGETKTESSSASVPVIEPLRSLLEKLRGQSADGFIIQSLSGNHVNLNSLNTRVITPAMQKAGIDWRGYYPARRGISSLVTDSSKNALNSTGLLRHSIPITALKHYTRAQKDSILTAMETIQEHAAEITKKHKAEVVQ